MQYCICFFYRDRWIPLCTYMTVLGWLGSSMGWRSKPHSKVRKLKNLPTEQLIIGKLYKRQLQSSLLHRQYCFTFNAFHYTFWTGNGKKKKLFCTAHLYFPGRILMRRSGVILGAGSKLDSYTGSIDEVRTSVQSNMKF